MERGASSSTVHFSVVAYGLCIQRSAPCLARMRQEALKH
jgi:hypothetical protein